MSVALAVLTFAVSAPAGTDRSAPSATVVQDRSERLDIADRRIHDDRYTAAVEVGLDRPLRVRLGAELQADRIDLRLRNVRGSYAFHGDLSRLSTVLNTRLPRASATQENP